jgi:hypothetical protein
VTQQTCDAIFRRVSVFKKKSVFSTFAKLKKEVSFSPRRSSRSQGTHKDGEFIFKKNYFF